jgi:TRAP-type C4-dicarboxylate transport system substrate-binding protein
VITSTTTAVDGKFWEVLNNFERFNITIATNMVNVNLRAFNKLDKKSQDALIAAGKAMEEKIWGKVAALDKEKEALCNKKGITSVPVSPEILKNLKKASMPIHKEWLKDAPADAVKIYHEFTEQSGK